MDITDGPISIMYHKGARGYRPASSSRGVFLMILIRSLLAVGSLALLGGGLFAQSLDGLAPPKAGPVEVLPLDQVTPGMKAIAWTTFSGVAAEPVPLEVIGVMRNTFGPGQHIIMAKVGGKVQRTNVAAGMSGSPVYYEGKLIGAISLRFSVFSPDAIAGITPIEAMLEINEIDQSRTILADGNSGGAPVANKDFAPLESSDGLAAQIWNSAKAPAAQSAYMTPVETPLTFSGVPDEVLRLFDGMFRQAGALTMQGGSVAAGAASGSASTVKSELNPGEPIAAVLISGDMSASGLGTVSYNDGKRVIGFGHAMFNMGRVEMPMAGAEVLTVLASAFSPVKVANSAQVVGALHQDRHSGIMGVMGDTAEMISVDVKVRRLGNDLSVLSEKKLHYNVFQNQKWTPQLLTLTFYNSMFGLNDFADETTFRLNGDIEIEGGHRIALETMRTTSEGPVPAPLELAGWVGDRIRRVVGNADRMPKVEHIDATIDLLPERRVAVIERVWVERTKVSAGDEIAGKVFLRPYRGERIEKAFKVKIPLGAPKGTLRLELSDANTVNRGAAMAGARNELMTVPETVSLLNKEHSNNQLFIRLEEPSVTAHVDDKTLPNVPISVLNVMRRSAGRTLALEGGSPLSQTSIPFDAIVTGSYAIRLEVE